MTEPHISMATTIRCLSLVFWVAVVLPGGTAVFQETFETDPAERGWKSFGDASLFRWNPTSQNLEVTWDSSRTNSFFHFPLGTILASNDDFRVRFDLRLTDIRTGATPGKSNEFEIAVGLLNYSSATNANAFRGAGVSPTYGVKNLIEFDYFPDAGFGETFATVVASTNNSIYPVHNFPLPMTLGDAFRITLTYTASNHLLRTEATRNGLPYGMPPDNTLADLSLLGKHDFRVDSFAVISYSDAIQTGPPSVHGSVLAHGTVDNVELAVPQPLNNLQLRFVEGAWKAEFFSRTGWRYALERSPDLSEWEAVTAVTDGNNGTILLTDPDPAAANAFYRVRAERP
jgi:hypothetical protein